MNQVQGRAMPRITLLLDAINSTAFDCPVRLLSTAGTVCSSVSRWLRL